MLKIKTIKKKLKKANEKALILLTELVKERGGFVATLPCDSKPTLMAVMDYSGELEYSKIYGLRYVPGEGLIICNDDMIKNYEYDEGYLFDYLHNFQGKDLEEVKKLLSREEYFINIEDETVLLEQTLRSILDNLTSYIS